MLSLSNLYKLKLPSSTDSLYTGKVTKELNKRQNYSNLHKKPEELKNKLPTPKNTQDQIAKNKLN